MNPTKKKKVKKKSSQTAVFDILLLTGNKALGDSYVLDMDKNKWTDVSAQIKLSPRAGHTAITVEQGGALSIVFFGGGDNEEGFFNDVFVVRYDDGLRQLLS